MNALRTLNESREIVELFEKFIQFHTTLILNQRLKARIVLYNYYTHEAVLRPLDGHTFGREREITFTNDRGNISFKTKTNDLPRDHFLKIRLPLFVEIKEERRYYREEFRDFPFRVFFNNVQALNFSMDSILAEAQLLNISERSLFLKAQGRRFQNYTHGDRIIFTSIHDWPIKKKLSGQIKTLHSDIKTWSFFIGVELDRPFEIVRLVEHLEEVSGKANPSLRNTILKEIRAQHGKLRNGP